MVVLARDETASIVAAFIDGRYEILVRGVSIPLWSQRNEIWLPPLGESIVAVRGGDAGFALLTETGDGASAAWTDFRFGSDGALTGARAVTLSDAFGIAELELAFGLDLDRDGSIGFEAIETLVETSALSVVSLAEGGFGVVDGDRITALLADVGTPWLPDANETIAGVRANETGYTILVANDAEEGQTVEERSFSADGSIVDSEYATFPGAADPSGPPSDSDGAPALLVKFAPGATAADMAAAVSSVGGALGEVVRGEGSPFHTGGVLQTISLGGGVDPDLAIQILSRLPGVEYAERNWTVSIEALSVEATSNDPYYTGGNLWGMYGDDTSPKNVYGSQAADAWLTDQTGSMSSVVGVIDTGIDPTHVDLYLNIWLNQEEIPSGLNLVDTDSDGLITFRDLNNSLNAGNVSDFNGNGRIDARDLLSDDRWVDGLDTDGNGFVDDFYGWDFRNEDNDPFDDHEHGTHVAGTIGALSNNGIGVVGVAWNVQIMALKFLSGTGSGDIADAVQATDYFTAESMSSTNHHFVATNNSWGGGGFSQSMLDAITAGALADILFVASAGNGKFPFGGINNDTNEHYPSNYNTTNGAGYDAVIAVASIASDGSLSSFSNYGEITVDLGAPGSGIWSTIPGDKYASYSGTSMASPHVTGGLALAAALSPGTSAEELRNILLASTTHTASLDGKTVTDGRLNVDTLLQGMVTVDVTAPVVTVDKLVTKDATPALTGTVDDTAATIYVMVDSQKLLATNNGNGTWSLSDNALSALADSVYDVAVTATDLAANVGNDTTTGELTIDTVAPAAPSVDALTTNDTTPTVTGDASLAAGETVSVSVAGIDYTEGNGLTVSGSNWSLTVGAPLTDGTFDVTASVTDAAGNATQDTTSGELVIDTTGPAVAITTITDDTGPSGSDFVTSDTTLIFSGTAEAGALVTLSLDGTWIADVTAVGGAWSFDCSTVLAHGKHTLEASASDSLNTTTVSQSMTVDTQAPSVSITVADLVLSVGETTSLTFAFSEAASGFDAGDVNLSGAGGGTLGTLSSADGGATWTATFAPAAGIEIDPAAIAVTSGGYTDVAGNLGTGASSSGFKIDTLAPTVAPSLAGVTAVETGVEITGTIGTLESDETLWVLRDGVSIGQTVPSDGNWSFVDTDPLAGGTYQYSALVQDGVGNQGPVSETVAHTVEGDVFIFGTDGSDTIIGTGISETISGLPDPASGSTSLGEGTVDVITGGGGADLFVLGDSLPGRGVYYDDDNPRAGNNGKSDYCQINDFLTTVDQIQLFGTAADYLFQVWTQNGVSGTGIFKDYGGSGFDSRDELIGLLADVNPTSLDVSADFLYV